MRKRPWNRRGFLKGALISASFIAISSLGHSLLRPGVTIADTLTGKGAVESPLPGKSRLILVFILDGQELAYALGVSEESRGLSPCPFGQLAPAFKRKSVRKWPQK